MRVSSAFALIAGSLTALAAANPLGKQAPLSTPASAKDAALFASWSWEDCGLPTDPVQLESISVSPNPPQPGKDLTVSVKGTATDTIEEGAYADVVVKLGLIKLLSKTFDVCEEARTANLTVQCPVQPGSYEVQHTVTLPKEIPPAKFLVSVNGYTVDDDDLLCLKLHVDFLKRPF